MRRSLAGDGIWSWRERMSDDPSAAIDPRITRAIVGALRERDLSGYAIWQWIGPVHGARGGLSQANLYPILYRLEAAGLLESSWCEGERTRRTYRITAVAVKEAERRGWGTLAPGRTRREGAAPGSGDGESDWVWQSVPDTGKSEDDPDPIPQDADSLRSDVSKLAPVAAFLAELDGSLRLSAVYRNDARNEIGDHIADEAAQLRAGGSQSKEAITEAIAALGPASDLAAEIGMAQLTSKRLRHGLQWASAEATLASFGTMALTWTVLATLTPALLWLLTHVGGALGFHLYAPNVGELHTEDLGIAGCVGAFVGARLSMPALSLKSRQAETVVWTKWALLGAPPLALMALLVPANLDPLSAATLVAIPFAWIAGTRRPRPPAGDVLTVGGVALTAAIAVMLVVLPGIRVWGFQPEQEPVAAVPYTAAQSASVNWIGEPGGTSWQVTVSLPPGSGWRDPLLEVWPARREGILIGPDPTSTQATQVPNGSVIDLASLSPNQSDWWVTVSAIGTDGERHTIAADPRLGRAPHFHGSLLNWLIHSI
jgi:DNA-binding PadR family transcriptional regulator